MDPFLLNLMRKKSLIEKVQDRLNKVEESISRQPVYHYPGQKYLYVFGFTKKGKAVCLGPYVNPQEADNILATLADGEIFEDGSRNLNTATRNIKAELIKRSGDADEALRKVLHKKGLEREEKRES